MKLSHSLTILTATCLLSLITLCASAPRPDRPPPSDGSQFLAAHNAARASLGAGLRPLVWDPEVAKFAQSYANMRKGDCALRHSSNMKYGENIFWGSGSQWAPAQAVGAWFSEKRWYNYGSTSCARGQMCGHYTQIVWRSTQRLGCAKVVCSGGKGVFITCNYDPPGNYVGERPY
uniref:SCP domain-containing protein n=1 Tax=Kalanchoe fedtschenkoi TaxID=63787 RepID=A0A7N0ZU73_KALFE